MSQFAINISDDDDDDIFPSINDDSVVIIDQVDSNPAASSSSFNLLAPDIPSDDNLFSQPTDRSVSNSTTNYRTGPIIDPVGSDKHIDFSSDDILFSLHESCTNNSIIDPTTNPTSDPTINPVTDPTTNSTNDSAKKATSYSSTGILARLHKLSQQQEKNNLKQLNLVNQTTRMNRSSTVNQLLVDCHIDLQSDPFFEPFKSSLSDLEVSIKYSVVSLKVNDAYLFSVNHKLSSKYDPSSGIFVPCSSYIKSVNTLIVLSSATDYASLLTDKSFSHLDAHILSIKRLHPNKKIIYMVYGIPDLVRKIEATKNKHIAAQVREYVHNSGSNVDTNNRNNSQSQSSNPLLTSLGHVDSSLFLLSFIHLLVSHSIHSLQPCSISDASSWFSELLKDISTLFYKKNSSSLLFSKPKPSSTSTSFESALEQIKFVTPDVSKAIVNAYPSLSSLAADLKAGPGRLADLKKGRAQGRHRVGKALAESIKKVLESLDPEEFV